jgi:hypothetical protein
VKLKEEVNMYLNALAAYEEELKELGMPYTKGRGN